MLSALKPNAKFRRSPSGSPPIPKVSIGQFVGSLIYSGGGRILLLIIDDILSLSRIYVVCFRDSIFITSKKQK